MRNMDGGVEYIVTAEEMRRADRATTEQFGMPALVLMENAARETAFYLLRHCKNIKRILVLAGGGNNGGDGMAAGRILFQQGCSVTVFFCSPADKMSPGAAHQKAVLEKYGVRTTDHFPQEEYDIIIDAVFGIGLTRAVEGVCLQALRQANEMQAYKVACDIPSGIDADTGKVLGSAFRADLTLTYGYLKRGLLFYPGAEYAGKTVCLDIGISRHSFLGSCPSMFSYGADAKALLPGRSASGNKGTFGKVLLMAGSPAMSGACTLAARALYRTGAGMVRVIVPEENRIILQETVPEAILHPYRLTDEEELDDEGRTGRQLLADIVWADCIVAGCGMGRSPAARRLLTLLFDGMAAEWVTAGKSVNKSLVLDADALNLIGETPSMAGRLRQLTGAGISAAVTPHPVEFSRLSGTGLAEIKEQPAQSCLAYAGRYGVITVLKDARTLVGLPDGTVYINRTGNSGMATAGSGDVLSGIIGALAAQGLKMEQAAPLGVWLHAAAGDLASGAANEYAVMATDIVEALRKVLKRDRADEED